MPETVLALARKAADVLAERGIDHARLESELLLAHVLGISRLDLYLQFDRPLSDEELERFRALVRRRRKHEPVQYIMGSAHFRAIELKVDARVLVPRPETEVLVGHVLDWARGRAHAGAEATGTPTRLSAVDIGTGSGAIALSLACEGPFERVVATDVSAEALALARENAARLGLAERIELRAGPLWQALQEDERFDVVASNPPYVSEGERPELPPEVADWEPAPALFAGDGFAVLDPLIEGAAGHLRPGGLLALEIGSTQRERVLERVMGTAAYAGARVLPDLTGRDRVLLAERR